MARPSGVRLLGVAYVAAVTVAVCAMIFVGFAVDRLLPAAVGRRYEPALFAAVARLGRPVDALGCRPTDRAVAEPVEAPR